MPDVRERVALVGLLRAGYCSSMKTVVSNRFGSLLGFSAALLALAVPLATAQEARPPQVQDLGSGSVILAYLIGGVLALAAVGLATMPSRREHQD